MLTTQVCNRLAYRCVPLYDSLAEDKVEFIINHADCQAIVLSSDKLPTIINVLDSVAANLQLVMYWGDTPLYDVSQPFADAGIELVSIEEMEGESCGANIEDPPLPGDICTNMYTSGTTGEPKGVLLSHRTMVATITAYQTKMRGEGIVFDESTRYLSYLPLAHILERTS